MIPNNDSKFAFELLDEKFRGAMYSGEQNMREEAKYGIVMVDDDAAKAGYVFLTKVNGVWVADHDLSDIQLEDSWLCCDPVDRDNMCAQLIDCIESSSNMVELRYSLDITRFTDRDDAIKTASEYMKRKLNNENGDTIHIQ